MLRCRLGPLQKKAQNILFMILPLDFTYSILQLNVYSVLFGRFDDSRKYLGNSRK